MWRLLTTSIIRRIGSTIPGFFFAIKKWFGGVNHVSQSLKITFIILTSAVPPADFRLTAANYDSSVFTVPMYMYVDRSLNNIQIAYGQGWVDYKLFVVRYNYSYFKNM
jgi:hypothetical protein